MFKILKKYIDSKIGITSDLLLWNTAIFFVVTGLVCFVLMLIDSRQVLGINTWIKPSKFSLSLATYVISFAYIAPKLQVSEKIKNRISKVTAFFLTFEYALIFMQAARGVQSHFNTDAIFDRSVYYLMGIAIITAMIPAGFSIYYLFKYKTFEHRLYDLANKYGLLVFFIGSMYGSRVSADVNSNVGADSTVSGIPYLDWSTIFGDLRVFHFFAMHALQLYVLVAFLLIRFRAPRLN